LRGRTSSREKSRFYLESRASRGNYRDQDMAANAKGHGSTRNNEKTMTFPQLYPRYIACDVMRSPHHASRSNVILRDERRTIGELSKSRSSKDARYHPRSRVLSARSKSGDTKIPLPVAPDSRNSGIPLSHSLLSSAPARPSANPVESRSITYASTGRSLPVSPDSVSLF